MHDLLILRQLTCQFCTGSQHAQVDGVKHRRLDRVFESWRDDCKFTHARTISRQRPPHLALSAGSRSGVSDPRLWTLGILLGKWHHRPISTSWTAHRRVLLLPLYLYVRYLKHLFRFALFRWGHGFTRWLRQAFTMSGLSSGFDTFEAEKSDQYTVTYISIDTPSRPTKEISLHRFCIDFCNSFCTIKWRIYQSKLIPSMTRIECKLMMLWP